ncbi:MAG: hypothetical protein LBP92_14450 [Deltaproteobacteria bacterium]|jgi:hypothetical protein|nr:hypothetical protein [Deltaproteobacteria bacterium]
MPREVVLDDKAMFLQLADRCPDMPKAVIRSAQDLIVQSLGQALAEGRPVTLRGFGRLIPRRYLTGAKKFGLLFHPSPSLTERLNRRGHTFRKK